MAYRARYGIGDTAILRAMVRTSPLSQIRKMLTGREEAEKWHNASISAVARPGLVRRIYGSRRLVRLYTGCLLFFSEKQDSQQDHADNDATIGHIEGWPLQHPTVEGQREK